MERTYRPGEALSIVYDPERTTLRVFDCDADDNGRVPALLTHTYPFGVPTQRYWQLVDDRQLALWWEPIDEEGAP